MMFRPGDLIDQYRLTGVLGTGAYGVVFAAVNAVSQQEVALKLVPLCGRAGQRELHALQTYHDLAHPNLLKLFHCGVAGDYLYYTMELAEGTLADRRLSPEELLAAAVKIADALAFLHGNGLIHRDIKPDNLFWRNGEPLLGDIGLVTGCDGASLTGTPGFLPPEVRYEGAALSVRSDLYALAKSFYCLLSGCTPGEYPKYDGPLDPAAAVLLRTVLQVCDGRKEIASAAKFRDALRQKPKKKRLFRQPRLLLTAGAAGVLLLTGVGYAGVKFFRNRMIRLRSASPLPAERENDRILRVIRSVPAPTAAEKSAINRQRKVYEEMLTQSNRLANERYPRKKKTDGKTMIQRHLYQRKILQEAVRQRAETDPVFRCYYVLYEEFQQLTITLNRLAEDPKYTELARKYFEQWRIKYEAYDRARTLK